MAGAFELFTSTSILKGVQKFESEPRNVLCLVHSDPFVTYVETRTDNKNVVY